MSVTLISQPPFVLNFQELRPKLDTAQTLCKKVTHIAEWAADFFIALGRASWDSVLSNAKSAWPTFKYVVLGYDGTTFNGPKDATELGIKLVMWAVVHIVGYLFTTVVLLRQHYRGMTSYLKSLVPAEIDLSHLTARKTKIDLRNVPDEITVSTLKDLYNDINFTRPDKPGYMPPSTRRENREFGVAELRRHLNTFVAHVDGRVAFLGTPPSYMASQLMQFYQKIEDATRYNIYKVTKEYNDFMRVHAGQELTKEHADYKQYEDLLQAKARLAIDMAIAGIHCGARYMGDAMDTYLSKQGEAQIDGQTLQSKLCTLLASKREKLARADIQRYMGLDTHAFSSYMANMGAILGIPGTEDIIEYLTGSSFDRERFLGYFFEAYTPDLIRDAVQNEVKKSQSFREVLFDWLKDQAKEWNKEVYEAHVKTIIAKIENPANALPQGSFNRVEQFVTLLQDLIKKGALQLKENKVVMRDEAFIDHNEKFGDFLDALFVLDATKTSLNLAFGTIEKTVQSARARQAFKDALKKPAFEAELKKIITASVKGEACDLDTLKTIASHYDKIEAINKAVADEGFAAIAPEVLMRVVTRQADLQAVLHDRADQQRKDEFLESLTKSEESPDEEAAQVVTRDGLKRPVLDWVLYANNILNPVR